RQAGRSHDVRRNRDVDRCGPARRRREGQAQLAPEREDLGSSALDPGFRGQASDVEIRAREAIEMKRRLEEILAEKTGQTLEQIARDTERDNFMTPREALEYGLIDEVVERR